MTPREIVEWLEQRGIRLRPNTDFSLRIDAPLDSLTPELLARIKAKEAHLVFEHEWDRRPAESRQIEELSREIGRLKQELDYAENMIEIHKDHIKILEGCCSVFSHQAKQQQAIPDDIQRIMLGLCHPDRHNNSPAANRVSAWLNQQRGRR